MVAGLKDGEGATGGAARRAALVALVPLLLGTFTGTLANTIVNVPLSLILDDLDVPLAAGSLLVVAFTVTFAVLLPISGWLGDRFGHRRVFTVAMAVIGIASAGAALAPGLAFLVVIRAIQGAATAAILPTVMALIALLFEGDRRGRAMALWAAMNGIGQAAGPALGGGLATWFGWRAVFWPLVPLGLAAAVVAARLVPRDRPRAVPLDWRGATLLTLAAGLGLGAASAVAPLGLGSPVVWLGAPAGVLAAVAFLFAERGRADAFLPPRLLLEIRYLRSCLTVLAQMFCLGATLLGVPLYLTTERDTTTLMAGALLLCLPLAMSVLDRGPSFGLIFAGCAAIAVLGLVSSFAGPDPVR